METLPWDKLTASKISARYDCAVYREGVPMSDDEETVSRRDLFSGWARGLRDGLAEWVLPEVEREVERIRDAFVAPDSPIETEHPWRDLLEPRDGDEDPETAEA